MRIPTGPERMIKIFSFVRTNELKGLYSLKVQTESDL